MSPDPETVNLVMAVVAIAVLSAAVTVFCMLAAFLCWALTPLAPPAAPPTDPRD